jgi:hypothetical protein
MQIEVTEKDTLIEGCKIFLRYFYDNCRFRDLGIFNEGCWPSSFSRMKDYILEVVKDNLPRGPQVVLSVQVSYMFLHNVHYKITLIFFKHM